MRACKAAAVLLALDVFALRLGEVMPRDQPLIVWNAEAIAGVFETQKIVMKIDSARRLRAVHVQITPDSNATAADLARLVDDVRRRLAEKLGRPAWERAGDLRLARTTQWETRSRTVRAGIPARIDGKLLVEIAITPRPLPRAEEYWSAD